MDASILYDAWNMYSEFQKAHSHIGSVLTAEFTFLFGDVASQLIMDKKINRKKLLYTAALAPIYGLGLEQLIETGEIVGRTISENPFVKAALGPNLWGPLTYHPIFFYNNTIGEKSGYSISALMKSYAAIFSPTEIKKNGFKKNFKEKFIDNIPKKEYKRTVGLVLTAWNVIQPFNYYVVPEHMRTSFILALRTVWTSAMTGWSSKGAKNINKKHGNRIPTRLNS